MKWMNCDVADNYPTDGRGAVTATAGSSTFLASPGWDNKMCVLIGAVVNPGTAATTLTITAHDGSATPVAPIKAPANASSFWVNLHGAEIPGIKAVLAGAGATATIFFDVGQNTTY